MDDLIIAAVVCAMVGAALVSALWDHLRDRKENGVDEPENGE